MSEKIVLEATLSLNESVSEVLKQVSFNHHRIIQKQQEISELLVENAKIMNRLITEDAIEIDYNGY